MFRKYTPMAEKENKQLPDEDTPIFKKEEEKSTLKAGLATPRKNVRYNPKIFSSPASKSRILTPIKSALQNSNRDTFKFIKKIQEIVDNKNKENINEENVNNKTE
ncbi:hypothetical protein NGRA_1359 [Nosema granulosis]|uniref:Uncharacterized protein n=1 Tax=Nosema granulosis TaxID=83296 RepID=A0A9P6H1X3_9MICR|nr:hypothetical protein NGRA_1359 [Nosema granulosis]